MPGVVRGTVSYNTPDLSVRPEDRGLFSGPAHKQSENVEVDLHDPTIAPELQAGPEGLDVQGFTYVKSPSALNADDWLAGTNVEETYVPEVEELVRRVTGAKRVVVNHLGIRKRLANNNANPKFYRKAGDQHDQSVKKLTEKDSAWGMSWKRFGIDRVTDGLSQFLDGKTQVLSLPALRTAITPWKA